MINNIIIDLTSKYTNIKVEYINYKNIIKENILLTKNIRRSYNLLKKQLQIISSFKIKDITEVNRNKMFLHYTNFKNLDSINKKGLEPNIGANSKVIEKTKKVFFSIGDQGALVIMDSWLKWLIAKPRSKFIYYIGAYLLKLNFFPRIIHKIIINCNKKNKYKYKWAYKNLKKTLSRSVYLVLNLEEGIDFSFYDIDEIKKFSNYPKSIILDLYTVDSKTEDKKVEYWNMHTFSNKLIERNKISLLKYKDSLAADKILQKLIEDNLIFVKENCQLLYNYYNFIYK